MFTWTTTQQAGNENGVKIFTYGDSGVGKTRLCTTAPRPMIVSCENRFISVRKSVIPVALIRTIQDARDILRWIRTDPAAADFDTVCLDSATELAELLLQQLKPQEKDPRKAYGQVQDVMLELLREFRDIPRKHVYIIAKMVYDKDESTGGMKFMPLLTGAKFGPQVPYLFDEVFRMGLWRDPATQAVHPFLQTQGDLQYTAKDSSGALSPMEIPDLSHIIGKILGGIRQ